MTEDIENKSDTALETLPEHKNEEGKRNVFDVIGDFFAKMLKGIFLFIFCKIPIKIWRIVSNTEQLKRLLKVSYSILRACFLCAIWISLVFLGWWFFLREQFIKFWLRCWQVVWDGIYLFCQNTLLFMKNNAGWIWMILTLCGSAYGLMYVTLKRKKMKNNAGRTWKILTLSGYVNGLKHMILKRKKKQKHTSESLSNDALHVDEGEGISIKDITPMDGTQSQSDSQEQ